ncbi:hypothetical protein DPMN_044475 [Dreissena polymorpha]|uniref:Uncharacterized protein n=1 Tax=Dreissena polymorpha TaxID=45954 RepID=A0A9D4D483_DREPO|nr:hypothetical protein DPMN_044475 [Dreissena polymorpha]
MQQSCQPLFIVESSLARTLERSRPKITGTAGQRAYQCGGYTGRTWAERPQNIEGVALENGPGAAVLSLLNALGKPPRGTRRRPVTSRAAIKAELGARSGKKISLKIISTTLAE